MPTRPTEQEARDAAALADRVGCAEAARQLGMNRTTLVHWCDNVDRWYPPVPAGGGQAGNADSASEKQAGIPDKGAPVVAASERERMLTDENKRLKAELSRKVRGEERIILECRAALDEMEIRPWPVVLPSSPRAERPVEHLILFISDTQIGKATATYGLAVAEQRMMEVAHRFLRIAKVRAQHAEIGSVTILLGGDAVEGEQIYGGQHWHVEIGVGPQSTVHGPNMHARLIMLIAAHLSAPINIYAFVGNHGRVGAINLPSSPQTNWDRVCYEMTRAMLERLAPGRFSFTIADDWYMVARLPGGWGAMLTHGDMINGAGTSASIVTKASGWAETIPEPWDYLMLGHFHKPWHLQTRGGTRDIYVNGSIESDDSDFVRGRMAVGGRPCQRMFVLTEERGIIEAPILYCDRRVPMGGVA